MAKCRYRYLVYLKNGEKIFDTFHYWDAMAWLSERTYIVRKDILGKPKQPDKTYNYGSNSN